MLNVFSLKKGAILKIVYWCNHKCFFCHEKDNIYSFNFRNILLEDLPKIYEWIQRNHFDYIVISWWEPTLHPQFIDIIDFFQKKWIYIVLVTNGSRLHTIDFSLIDNKKLSIYVSFHWLKEEYNSITQSVDFDLVTNNIKEIHKLCPEIIIRYVVNKYNIDVLEEFIEFAFSQLGNIMLELVLVEDLLSSDVEHTAVPLKEFYKKILPYSRDERILFDWWIACIDTYLFANAQYKFDPLVNTMVWLVKKTKESEIMYDIKEHVSSKNIRSHWSKCKSCKKFDYCHGFDTKYLKYK